MSARSYNINKTKKYGNITVINGEFKLSVILHSTEVLRYNKVLNKIHISSGNWLTPTTKTAINNGLTQLEKMIGQSLPKIVQKKGQWFLTDGQKFEDGMVIAVYPLLRALA